MRDLVVAGYGQLVSPPSGRPASLDYRVWKNLDDQTLHIHRSGLDEPLVGYDESTFLFLFEKDVEMELQRLRADLFFVHAGVVCRKGRAALLVAPSGTGKSTLTLALVQNGFGYLSDELAPIDVSSMRVHQYAHALCLKREPVPPCTVPAVTLRLGQTLHVAASELSPGTQGVPLAVAAAFFLERPESGGVGGSRRIRAAETAARLYTNALNPLAHSADGLEAVLQIAAMVPGFILDITDLGAASRSVAMEMV